MIRFSILIVACVIGSLVSQEQGPATTPLLTHSSPGSSPPQTVVVPQKVNEEVADIMAIRDQIGGGVAEALGDFSLEMPGKKQAEGAEGPSPSLDEQFRAALASEAQAAVADVKAETAAEQGLVLPARSHEAVDPSERQEMVWEAARQLEGVAALLEEVSEFERADQLRQTAAELWKSVRKSAAR